jgi:hypothetical protein
MFGRSWELNEIKTAWTGVDFEETSRKYRKINQSINKYTIQ